MTNWNMQNLSLRGDVKTQVLAVGEKEKKLKDAVRLSPSASLTLGSSCFHRWIFILRQRRTTYIFVYKKCFFIYVKQHYF